MVNEQALLDKPWVGDAVAKETRVTKPLDYFFEFCRVLCGAYKDNCWNNQYVASFVIYTSGLLLPVVGVVSPCNILRGVLI